MAVWYWHITELQTVIFEALKRKFNAEIRESGVPLRECLFRTALR